MSVQEIFEYAENGTYYGVSAGFVIGATYVGALEMPRALEEIPFLRAALLVKITAVSCAVMGVAGFIAGTSYGVLSQADHLSENFY